MFSKYSFLVFPKIIQTEISLFFIALPSFTGASFVKNFCKSWTAHDSFAQLLYHKGNVVKSLDFFLHRCLWRRNFSLVAHYSLWNHSLLVAKNHLLLLAKFARHLWQKLLVAKIHSLLVAKIHSLLVAKFARYSSQNLHVAKNHSFIVAKFARYSLQKLLVAKSHLLLVAKFARYSLQKLLVAKICLL